MVEEEGAVEGLDEVEGLEEEEEAEEEVEAEEDLEPLHLTTPIQAGATLQPNGEPLALMKWLSAGLLGPLQTHQEVPGPEQLEHWAPTPMKLTPLQPQPVPEMDQASQGGEMAEVSDPYGPQQSLT